MKELLLIPGPTPVSEEVLSALSKETLLILMTVLQAS